MSLSETLFGRHETLALVDMRGMGDDLRHSIRSLRRAPGLSTIIVLTVAIGIGASTSLFSVIKAVLLNPLPYLDPGRLAWVATLMDSAESRTSLPDFDNWRAENHSFVGLAAYTEAPLVVSGDNEPQQTQGTLVSEDFFDVLGTRPVLGRVFSLEEHRTGPPLATVVIGYGLWQRAYGSDPNIIGRKVRLVGLESTVIGVMPRGFAFPAGAELWTSARALAEGNIRSAHNYWVIGRLLPTISLHAAHDEINSIAQHLKQQFPGPFQANGAIAIALSDHLFGSVRTPFLMLFAAVGLLLLIVCGNVANLLLVRLAARSGELAVRAALGAGTARIFRHLFVEALVLASAGGVFGVLIASWSINLLRVLLPASIPRAAEVRIDAGVLSFALSVTALAGILFGTLPSWRATYINIQDALKTGSRSHTANRRLRRTQSALVISEVALSVLLLAGAGLLLSSFARLLAVDPGFRGDHVLAVNLSWPAGPAERTRILAGYHELLTRARVLPGVSVAGVIKDLPLDPVQREGHVRIASRHELNANAGLQIVSPGTMEALRIPLLHGRRFTEADTADSTGVAIVSAEMARRFWPGRDPIGERIWFDSFDPKPHWLAVVGIAGDIHNTGLTEPVRPQAYVCYTQLQIQAQLVSGGLVVRSASDPKTLAGSIRRAIREIEPEAATGFRTMDDLLAGATGRQRFQLQVFGSFAILALLLATIGIYGVLSYTVASSRSAIGIRMALGARPVDVFRMVLQRALLLVSAGTLLGIGGWLAVGGLLRRVLFGIAPDDPVVLVGTAVLMGLVAMAACCLPARRAMSVDPLNALRAE